MANPQLILFINAISNLQDFKSNNHHYCGFFSSSVLPGVCNDNVVIIDNMTYVLPEETFIKAAYDGKDTILTSCRSLVTSTHIPEGVDIYNSKRELIGLVTERYQDDNQPKHYYIQSGFDNINIHLSDIKLEIVNKTSVIAYAGHQFSSKPELVNYLGNASLHVEDKVKRATLYHVDGRAAQLIIHSAGFNIANIHLRTKIARTHCGIVQA